MKHRVDFMSRDSIKPLSLDASDVRAAVYGMLNYESFEANDSDVETMRLTIGRIPLAYDAFEDVRAWLQTKAQNGRSLGVASFFLYEYADLFGRVDVDLIAELSGEIYVHQPVRAHYPDWIVLILAIGFLRTKDKNLSELLKNLNATSLPPLCRFALTPYRKAVAIAQSGDQEERRK